MWPHDCANGDRYGGFPTLPCTPDWHHWGWYAPDIALRMLLVASHYGVTLLVDECHWACRWHTEGGCLAAPCGCAGTPTRVAVWRGHDAVTDLEGFWNAVDASADLPQRSN